MTLSNVQLHVQEGGEVWAARLKLRGMPGSIRIHVKVLPAPMLIWCTLLLAVSPVEHNVNNALPYKLPYRLVSLPACSSGSFIRALQDPKFPLVTFSTLSSTRHHHPSCEYSSALLKPPLLAMYIDLDLLLQDEAGPDKASQLKADFLDLNLAAGAPTKLAFEGPPALSCSTRAVLGLLRVKATDIFGNLTTHGCSGIEV